MTFQAGVQRLQRRIGAFVRRRSRDGRRDSVSGGPAFQPGGSTAHIHHTREVIASIFLHGDGIEIGALHQPLRVPPSARVKYVDRMPVPELRRQYEELAHEPLVEIDIIDNGEQLTTIGGDTQEFVIANHFLEHCQNPVQTLQNLFRVLKPEGILYVAVPDKRFTFDADRPSTTVEHVMRDFSDGPGWSKRQHFEEWSRLVNKRGTEGQVAAEVEHLLQIDYSIHFHVWRAADLLELMVAVQRLVQFEVELFLRNGFETILILRKAGQT